MKEERIIMSLGDISDKYIMEAMPGKGSAAKHDSAAGRQTLPHRAWLRWASVAAGLVLIIAAVSASILLNKEKAVTEDGAALPPDAHGAVTDNTAYGKTSDKYTSLPELLEYLSDHDYHDGKSADAVYGGRSAAEAESADAGLVESSAVAVSKDGKYAYHIGENVVHISRLDGNNTEHIADIGQPANAVFVFEDTLILVSQFSSGGTELDEEYSVRVGIYDISTPDKPVMKDQLRDEYTQLGSLNACWMTGEQLHLITEDGVCACGYSRLDDTSKYYPSLRRGMDERPWDDSEISILGEPTRVHYCAVTVINAVSGEIEEKRALYGDIKSIFYGEDWLAASVAGETENVMENPVIYTFDDKLSYTGKIVTAKLLNVPEKNTREDFEAQDGTYIGVTSVTKADGIYRMLGSCSVINGGSNYDQFLAIAAKTETGEASYSLLPADGYPYGSYTEILWEQDRAVACVGIINNALTDRMKRETRFVFAEFDGMDITFRENELRADYLDSRVGTTFGTPFGEYDTLIPLENGIYARYTRTDEGFPGGFELYDLSDSASPRRLYSPDDSLSGDNAFDYAWHVYDGHTFGTLKVILGSDDSFRDVSLAWCVYSVDPSAGQPFTLVSEQPIDGKVKTFFGADSLGFEVFAAGDGLYCVTNEMTVPEYIG